MSGTVTPFDIQLRLAADADGTARQALEEELAALQQTLRHRLDAGLPPDEFRRTTSLLDGVVAASETVALVWRAYHKR
ncbi:MAG: hypothetical protein U1E70_16640 [Acetobacteraceae bacterium]|nr:hypothetical protein [Pseudomonadota bacterium]